MSKTLQTVYSKTEAQEIAGKAFGITGRTVRTYEKQYDTQGDWEQWRWAEGSSERWLLSDEDLQLEARAWLRSSAGKHGVKITVEDFHKYCNEMLLPQALSSEQVEAHRARKRQKKKATDGFGDDGAEASDEPPVMDEIVSIRTCRAWLHRLGFRNGSTSKVKYIDGHEAEEVKTYRQEVYLPLMLLMLRYDGTGASETLGDEYSRDTIRALTESSKTEATMKRSGLANMFDWQGEQRAGNANFPVCSF
jgi:hypothetical protein